ncbi:rRNA-processing protein Fcf2p [[Candida] anglica]|uniref:rRNA-processing protein Fcf2p n=1 Tax=[Candida] anglica TaxID=148631 RepID=A0ABP0EJB9_9ASCO
MSPHTLSEPTIVETSETELISGTESLSDLGAAAVQYKVDAKLSLDDLFAELAEETSTGQTTVKDPEQSEDEFSKIRKAMSKLPKIESSLEAKLEQHDKNTITGKGHDITRINDPIEHIRSSAAEKAKLGEDAGAKWFNMRKPELTAAVKRDLLVIQQRSALDPKRHYKKDKWQIPKFFETGTIIEGNTEFYSRMKRKDRGNTLVEEVLNDQDKGKYFKRKYAEIQEKKTSGKRGHYKKVKEMRKKF